jgi:hypothetical protein
MTKRRRRFEVLLPHQYNDGRPVPEKLLGKAYREILDHFGAVTYEPQKIKGMWRHQGRVYHEKFSKVVVDVADTVKNRRWSLERNVAANRVVGSQLPHRN